MMFTQSLLLIGIFIAGALCGAFGACTHYLQIELKKARAQQSRQWLPIPPAPAWPSPLHPNRIAKPFVKNVQISALSKNVRTFDQAGNIMPQMTGPIRKVGPKVVQTYHNPWEIRQAFTDELKAFPKEGAQ